MKLEPRHKELIFAFAARHPIPTSSDEAAREWTHRLCQQLAFSCPLDGWGHKRFAPGHPLSADTIAIQTPFVGWDVVANSGSPDATLNFNADSADLVGQVFEPVVPTNWLVTAPEPPPVDPPPPAPTEGCPCEAKLDAILVELRAQREAVERTSADLVAAVKGGIKIRF